MADIDTYINQIRHAVYGRDVREAIAAGIEACHEESGESGSAIEELQNHFPEEGKFVVGTNTSATKDNAVAEGEGTEASGLSSHAEGRHKATINITPDGQQETVYVPTKASGEASHAEGTATLASGPSSHSEGMQTTASGNESHAEGFMTKASGNFSHSEGNDAIASGYASHAEGFHVTASGTGAHAEGKALMASNSVVKRSIASGQGSHVEGTGTTAEGGSAHAEGLETKAHGDCSHSEGQRTIANGKSQHVVGEYNVEDTPDDSTGRGKYVEIVGNGTANDARSNARTLDWDGNEELAGSLTLGKNSNDEIEISPLIFKTLFSWYLDEHQGQASPLSQLKSVNMTNPNPSSVTPEFVFDPETLTYTIETSGTGRQRFFTLTAIPVMEDAVITARYTIIGDSGITVTSSGSGSNYFGWKIAWSGTATGTRRIIFKFHVNYRNTITTYEFDYDFTITS